MIHPSEITALVLAGGRGSRMGGVDKGLQGFRGLPLALHALQRLQPQVGRVMISANRNLPAYEAFGVPVWPDGLADHAGPLAGFLTALEHCTTPWLLTVPCDSPRFPADLAARLAAGAQGETAKRWGWAGADGRHDPALGEVGVISSVTQAFCGDCNRARLSMEGRMYLCLFATQGWDLRSLLRGDAGDAQISAAIAHIWQGRTDRYSEIRRSLPADTGGQGKRRVEMSYIGG